MALAPLARRTIVRLKDVIRHSRLAYAVVFAKTLTPNVIDPNPIRRAKRLLRAYRLTFRAFWVRRLARRLGLVRAMPEEEVLRTTQATWSWSA